MISVLLRGCSPKNIKQNITLPNVDLSGYKRPTSIQLYHLLLRVGRAKSSHKNIKQNNSSVDVGAKHHLINSLPPMRG
jgi:hypothetical protein